MSNGPTAPYVVSAFRRTVKGPRESAHPGCQSPAKAGHDLRWVTVVAVTVALIFPTLKYAAAQSAQLPTQVSQTKFDSGQNVVPVYEGWIRNPDESFDLVFGYFNRNYKEELAIPAGPNNSVEPGGPDRGQPTYFLPRRRARLFRVRVPKDFGQQVLTWTITVNGRTEKAYGDLLPVEEINERIIMSGGNTVAFGDEDPNTPPRITVAPVPPVALSSPVPLTATVTDDGLPKPRTPPARPTATQRDGTIQRQVNSSGPTRPRGLTVTWFQYGGPAKVTFDPAGPIPVAKGTAVARARFDAPGTYRLVATASDGQLSQRTELTITVADGHGPGKP
jgi:hypothetical protein